MSARPENAGAGVRLDLDDGVARVTLDRPARLNAVDAATDAALDRIWGRRRSGPGGSLRRAHRSR